MSITSDRLGAKANAVSNDLKEMGGIVKDAAQEKLEQVRESLRGDHGGNWDKLHELAARESSLSTLLSRRTTERDRLAARHRV